MGIRYEKDTILNWINEMGKFLRLIVDSYDAFDEQTQEIDIEAGYQLYFSKQRDFFITADLTAILAFADELDPAQVRPLAQLLMYDGLIHDNQVLLAKSKQLFERNMQKTGAFSFEDYDFLSKIDKALKKV